MRLYAPDETATAVETANIEVTPAMERAGIVALYGFDSETECPGEYVRKVYLAMALAALETKRE